MINFADGGIHAMAGRVRGGDSERTSRRGPFPDIRHPELDKDRWGGVLGDVNTRAHMSRT